jgi:enterochelin esterase-like enzyme
MKRIIQGSSILILVLIFFAPVNIFAQDNAQDVVIGKIIQLDSKVLGEKRQIMVYLPPGYDQTSTKYPVLYLLDGRTHFQHASSTVQFLSQNGRDCKYRSDT